VTLWLNQPFTSGGRSVFAAATVGAVASYLSPNEPDAELPALSLQVPETEAEPLSGPE
jgi:hypothetical protein